MCKTFIVIHDRQIVAEYDNYPQAEISTSKSIAASGKRMAVYQLVSILTQVPTVNVQRVMP